MTADPDCRRATAFLDGALLSAGDLARVAAAVWEHGAPGVVVLDDATGRTVDLDLRGGPEALQARYAAASEDEPVPTGPGHPKPGHPKPGRPKLGVTAREVTLLPRHWDWLATQRGGASATLRRLIEEARRSTSDADRRAAARDAAYRAMSTLAGDRPGFEEASRRLFAGDLDGLAAVAALWPPAVADYVLRLARG